MELLPKFERYCIYGGPACRPYRRRRHPPVPSRIGIATGHFRGPFIGSRHIVVQLGRWQEHPGGEPAIIIDGIEPVP